MIKCRTLFEQSIVDIVVVIHGIGFSWVSRRCRIKPRLFEKIRFNAASPVNVGVILRRFGGACGYV